MEISRITDFSTNPCLPTLPKTLSTKLFICIYLHNDKFEASVTKLLSEDRYLVALTKSDRELVHFIEENTNLDCLLFQEHSELTSLVYQLQNKSILLPAVIIKQSESENFLETQQLTDDDLTTSTTQQDYGRFIYHQAEVSLLINQLDQIDFYLEEAIQKFLKLSPASSLKDNSLVSGQTIDDYDQNILHQQQHRLYAKLRERLGYLGVYYKRNPVNFIRNMPPGERHKFVDQLKLEYRHIVLKYFSQDNSLNNRIDEFVNLCFFSDIPVTKIVEIHMDLMDEFAKQLKLEGRSEEILLDYRLTLIDTIAHLCEMYRRSIPRES